jgi:hypothetical protein
LYQSLLCDASFFEFLRQIDLDLAAEARSAGCLCGGVLHAARYPRKPRGGPSSLGREHSVRESFCCAEEGCRRRATPASVRFLGRKVFFCVVILLIPILRDGLTPERFRRLERQLPVSRRTVQRWRGWWCEVFMTTQGGQRARAEIPGLEARRLPASLLEAFSGSGLECVVLALRWLAPLGSGGHAR